MAFRENVAKVAQKINGDDIQITESSPEYYTLNGILTDEMCDVLLCMELRAPTTAEFLAPDCGKTVEETSRILFELADLGVIMHAHVKGYDVFLMIVYVPGMYEMLVINKDLVEKHPEIAKGFEEYTREHFKFYAPNAPVGGALMRVIPVETAISGETTVLKYDEVSYYIEKNREHIAVTGCQCRRSRRLMGEGCGHLEDDMCIILGSAADTMVKQERARKLTAGEAYEILKKAEENGLVHQITNMEGPGKVFAICNCCSCSCFALRISQYLNTPNLSRSNYVAEVDAEKCTACGQCAENCNANALKLGQKLCTKTPIVEAETLLPDDNEWGPERYDPDFRTNRRYVVETGTAPCKTACPAHIAVQGYIKLASQGKYIDALELIKKENPFPAVCGRVCPHGCESECTRGEIDEPLAIDEIKKFIADQELKSDYRYIPKKRHNYGSKKIAIIGAGPAGLSCAYYLAIDGYSVTIFEKQEKLGGMLTLGIPFFRLDKSVVSAEIDILRDMGVEFKTGVEVGTDVTIAQLRREGYSGFYIAIGAQAGRKLGIEGEDAVGVISGVDFLREINLGKHVKIKDKVVVIGGGNVAIDVARSAVRERRVEAVEMYCLEGAGEMPALPEEIEEAKAEGITINNGWGPKRILTEDGKVTGVEFKRCVSVFDKGGRFAPKYDDNETMAVEASYVLVSIGQSIEWGGLLDGMKVQLGRGDTAVADSFTYQTAEPGIFVGGDVFTGPKFAIDAIAAGKEGAISLHRSVWDGQSLIIGRNIREFTALDKANLDMDSIIKGYDNTSRQRAGHSERKAKTFLDARLSFTEEQLKLETARCLGCGAVKVDQNRCLGCGVCTTKCKLGAIKLIKKYDAQGIAFEDLPRINAECQKLRMERIAIKKAAAK